MRDDPGRGRPVLFERAPTEPGGLAVRAVAGRGTGVLAVVFSQVRVPAGHFGLSRLFARTDHAALFLNQPENAWYRDAEAAVDAAIAEAEALTGARRTVLYGSSMGGWGAIAAAARHPQAALVAFAPDYAVGELGSRSAEAGLPARPGEATAAGHLAARSAATTTVLTGLFDPYDAGVACRLAPLADAGRLTLVPVASAHEVHDHLYARNVVRRIIAGFTRDPAAEVAERGLSATLDRTRHARFADLAARLGAGGPVDPAAVGALDLAGNPGALLLEAAAHEARGDLAAAERVLAAATALMEAVPALTTLPKRYRKAPIRRRIDLLERLGRGSDAAALARTAAAAFPEDAGFADRAARTD